MNSVTYVLYREDVDYCVLIDCGFSEELIASLEKLGKHIKNPFFENKQDRKSHLTSNFYKYGYEKPKYLNTTPVIFISKNFF